MEDAKLPALAQALNRDGVRADLSSLLNEDSNGNRQLSSEFRQRVLKHKPGKHCVIQYWLKSTNGSPQEKTVIGKLYRDNRGEKRYSDMKMLWQTARRTNLNCLEFGMPKPLAFLESLGMVVQEVVPGKLFFEFTANNDLSKAVALIAKNLAVLHRLPVSRGEPKLIAQHIEKYCRPGPEKLKAAYPELAEKVERILSALNTAQPLQTAPLCPAHGDLGLAQIFIHDNRAYFIDFDGFCQTHPALDAGNFLIALKTYHQSRFAELEKTFINSYLEINSPEMLNGLQFYKAFAYLRRATICFRKYQQQDRKEKIETLLNASIIEIENDKLMI